MLHESGRFRAALHIRKSYYTTALRIAYPVPAFVAPDAVSTAKNVELSDPSLGTAVRDEANQTSLNWYNKSRLESRCTIPKLLTFALWSTVYTLAKLSRDSVSSFTPFRPGSTRIGFGRIGSPFRWRNSTSRAGGGLPPV